MLHPSCDHSFLSTEEFSVSYYDFIVVIRRWPDSTGTSKEKKRKEIMLLTMSLPETFFVIKPISAIQPYDIF